MHDWLGLCLFICGDNILALAFTHRHLCRGSVRLATFWMIDDQFQPPHELRGFGDETGNINTSCLLGSALCVHLSPLAKKKTIENTRVETVLH